MTGKGQPLFTGLWKAKLDGGRCWDIVKPVCALRSGKWGCMEGRLLGGDPGWLGSRCLMAWGGGVIFNCTLLTMDYTLLTPALFALHTHDPHTLRVTFS